MLVSARILSKMSPITELCLSATPFDQADSAAVAFASISNCSAIPRKTALMNSHLLSVRNFCGSTYKDNHFSNMFLTIVSGFLFGITAAADRHVAR